MSLLTEACNGIIAPEGDPDASADTTKGHDQGTDENSSEDSEMFVEGLKHEAKCNSSEAQFLNSDLASRWLQIQAAQHFALQTKLKISQGKDVKNDDEKEEKNVQSMIEDVENAITEYNSAMKRSMNKVKTETSQSSASSKNDCPSPPLDLSSPDFSPSECTYRNGKPVFPLPSSELSLFLKDNPFLFRSPEDLVNSTPPALLPSLQPPNWAMPIIPNTPNTIPPPPLSLMPKSIFLGRPTFNSDLKQKLADTFPHLIRTHDKQSVPRMNFNHIDPRFIATRVPGFSHPSIEQFQASRFSLDSFSMDVQHLPSTNKSTNDSSNYALPKGIPMASLSSRSSSVSTPSSIGTSTPPIKTGVPQDVFRCLWCQEQYHSLASLTEHLKEAKHSSPIPPTSHFSFSSANSPLSLVSNKRLEALGQALKSTHPQSIIKKPKNISTKLNSLATNPDNRNQSASPATNQNTTKHHLQKGDGSLPRKLVRGQDVWLGKGQEQTRQILKCMWCGSSFKTLAELTQHMQETQHYTKVISQEQITSWRSQAAAEGKSTLQDVTSPLIGSPTSSADSPTYLSSSLSSSKGLGGVLGGIFDSALSEKIDTKVNFATSNKNLHLDKDQKDCISAILSCKVG